MNHNIDSINGSRILITGGTGSFGHFFVDKILAEYDVEQVIILSRDEKKQHDMRNRYHSNKLVFIIGDVRDRETVFRETQGIDYIFHAAALKQVPSCEFFPMEAVKTNILGASNVLDAAEANGAKKVVVLSTDKAVNPINAMGMSKALMEKLMLAKARRSRSGTIFCGVRYGNVMYSRGSVLPLFVQQIQEGKALTVTNPDMTRYLLPLPVAIDLVCFAFAVAESGDVLVRKSPAATVRNTALAMKAIFNYDKEIEVIGIREGEKMHETLVTKEELLKTEEYEDYYRIKNLTKVDYDRFYSIGQKTDFPEDGYTSQNTRQLSMDESKELILSLREIAEIMERA